MSISNEWPIGDGQTKTILKVVFQSFLQQAEHRFVVKCAPTMKSGSRIYKQIMNTNA